MAFIHNSELAKNEPKWSDVDRSALPRIAFAGKGEADKKSTWSYPHHWVEGGGKPDKDGIYADGTLYLHKGGLNAAWSAANGGHSGHDAPAEIKDHLEAHRKALGLDKQQAPKQFSIPASACRLLADVTVGDNGGNSKTAPIKIVARSGNPIEVPGLDAPLLHDFAGMQAKPRVALDWSHNGDLPLGYCNKFDTGSGELVASGTLVSTKPDDKAAEVMAQHKAGIPMEASIDWRGPSHVQSLEEGQCDTVNGKTVNGPLYIARNWPLTGIALCLHGVDGGTSAQFAAGDTVELTVIPKGMPVQNSGTMSVETSVETAVVDAAEKVEAVAKEAVAAVEKAVETATKAVEAVVEPTDTDKDEDPHLESVDGEDKPVETQTVEAAKPAVEAKQTEVPVESKTLSQGERFLQAFGDKGGVWFAQGKSYDEAMQLHVQQLSLENAELKERLTASRGATTPLSFSEPITSDAQRELSEATNELAKQGISPAVASLAAAMKLHREKKA